MNSAWIPNLFLDQESSDVQLRIETTAEDRQRLVPAHSLVLRFASKVFRIMLETGNFKEGQTGIVDLKVKGNMEDAIFFLRYLYTRELEEVDLNVYISLLQTAHLYDVEDLVMLCNERIVRVVTPLTVCRTYEILKDVASGILLVHCKDLMLEFAFLIFRKDLHLFLSEETMCFLLGSDKLNALDEEQALGALWRWGCTCQALENKPVNTIDEQIGKFLPLLRAPLINHVASHSPCFGLWEQFKSRTDVSECDPPTKTDITIRQPNGKIYRFFEVAHLSRFADKTVKISALSKSNCLMKCSLDRDILLSGLIIEVEVGEKLTSQYTFQVYVNNVKVSQLDLFEEFLVNEYPIGELQPTLQKNAFNFGTNHTQPTLQQGFSPSSGANQTTPINNRYVYYVLIHFRTPVMLKKTVVNILTMDITPDPKKPFSLMAYSLHKDTVLKFEGNLRFHAQHKTVAVRQMRYFV